LYVLTYNYASATTLLERFLTRLEQSVSASDLDVRYAPGLIGTLISLYSSQGRRGPIKSELSRAMAYWREKYEKDSSSQPPPSNLAKAAGKVLLESGEEADARTASNIFSDLLKHDNADRSAIAGLIAAQAASDPSTLDQQHLDSLTPVQRLITGIDAAALEEAGIPHPPTTVSSAVSSKKRKAEAADSQPKPAKKKKKLPPSRIPKNFEEGKKVDPERWLPMRDRSYFRPKKGKKKARGKGADLTQGGPVVEEEGRSGTATPVLQGPGGGGGGGGGKKGKGKKKR
ncbi:hypothetical protein LTS18_013289, partial [Coniosporium uncinatum]